jgi:hypothetical protein
MFTIKCQYTGIEFEAESKRTKNHPAVTRFLNEANDDGKRSVGAYAEAKRLLTEAAGNFDDIDSLMAYVTAAYAAWKDGAKGYTVVTHKQRMEAQRQRDEAWRNRNTEDEESMDFAGATAFEVTYGYSK